MPLCVSLLNPAHLAPGQEIASFVESVATRSIPPLANGTASALVVTDRRRHHLQLRGSPVIPFFLFPSTRRRFITTGELGNELNHARRRLSYFPLSTSGPT